MLNISSERLLAICIKEYYPKTSLPPAFTPIVSFGLHIKNNLSRKLMEVVMIL